MKLISNFSYRTQFSLLIIGFILCLSMSSLIYLKRMQNDFIALNLTSQGEVLSSLIAEDLAKLIYLDDPDVAAEITFKLQAIDELKNATFYDLERKAVLNINSNEGDFPAGYILNVETKVVYDGFDVGYADINLFSKKLYEQQLISENFFLAFIVILIVVGLFLVYLFDRRFIFRLSELSEGLSYVASEKDFSKRLVVDRNDDIGAAKNHFNQLVHIVDKQTIDLTYQANHDSLTHLYNRHRLLERIEAMLAKRPSKGFHSVCYLDLDQFKVVNDTCGHSVGDELLCQLSGLLLDKVSSMPGVVLGRIGGDEFVVLISDQSKGKIHSILHKLQLVVQGFSFTFLEREFRVGVSVGAILFSNEEVTTDELLSAADALCYQVKKTNRGDLLLQYLNDEELLGYQDEMTWVSRIYSAFAQDQFCVYLQPIVAIDKGDDPWNHYESLIRLYDGDEIISPLSFIPVAERYGLTKKLDLWMIESVFIQLKEFPRFLDSLELISINLSVLSIVDKKFHKSVRSLFKRYEMPFEKICFEITETGVISALDKAQTFISDFRRLGVTFSLDDFGSGMSSFGYLKDLEVEILKIDGQFVNDIYHDPVMKAIVSAMVEVGHITNKKVVAEHVEDKVTLDLLKTMGVDYIQGYYYSKPMLFSDLVSNQESKVAP